MSDREKEASVGLTDLLKKRGREKDEYVVKGPNDDRNECQMSLSLSSLSTGIIFHPIVFVSTTLIE